MTYTTPYNYNPTPQQGSGAFGAVPGVISIPNPAGDLANQIRNLGGINDSLFGNLLSELQGQLPQADANFSMDQSAGKAVRSGMPGLNPGTLQGNSAARNLGLLQYQMQQSAAQQYPSLVGAVSNTQTVAPALQADIAAHNSLNAAAPNPEQAASYARQLFDQYLQYARGPGGGTLGSSGPARGSGNVMGSGAGGGVGSSAGGRVGSGSAGGSGITTGTGTGAGVWGDSVGGASTTYGPGYSGNTYNAPGGSSLTLVDQYLADLFGMGPETTPTDTFAGATGNDPFSQVYGSGNYGLPQSGDLFGSNSIYNQLFGSDPSQMGYGYGSGVNAFDPISIYGPYAGGGYGGDFGGGYGGDFGGGF